MGTSEPKEERLSKFIARAGVSSRRKADEMISQGLVSVNHHRAVLGQKIRPGLDVVAIGGRRILAAEPQVYIALNKPAGYLSSCSDPFGRSTVLALLAGVDERVYPAGRLDMDSEGLLVLTNDGRLAYLLTHPKHGIVKEYVVEVTSMHGAFGETAGRAIPAERPVQGTMPHTANAMSLFSGIILDGKRVEVDYAEFLGRPGMTDAKGEVLTLKLGVHEGEKHLVKRLCRQAGFRVEKLTRTKIGSLTVSGIARGKWRHLTEDEVRSLYLEAQRGGEGDEYVAES